MSALERKLFTILETFQRLAEVPADCIVPPAVEAILDAVAAHDPNPWRYSSRGELPTQQRFYLVTDRDGRVWECKWTGARWQQDGHLLADGYIRAWKHKPEPARDLELEENLLPNSGKPAPELEDTRAGTGGE